MSTYATEHLSPAGELIERTEHATFPRALSAAIALVELDRAAVVQVCRLDAAAGCDGLSDLERDAVNALLDHARSQRAA